MNDVNFNPKKIIYDKSKEGEYNPHHHVYMHISEDGERMDCNPKSYGYILDLEEKYNKVKGQLDDIRNYIKQSDLYKMLWGKEIMRILDREVKNEK